MADVVTAFREAVGGLFNDPKFSDAVLECGSETFHVHRVVLSTQSSFFNKAFAGEWNESKERKITLEEDTPEVVDAMLRFMYHFNYDEGSFLQARSSPMVFHAEVYGIADKYDIPFLATYAKEKFKEAISTGWDKEDFPQAILEAYSSTPESDRGLRDLILNVCQDHISDLRDKPSFVNAMRQTTSLFAADLAQRLAKSNQPDKLEKYRCPSCHQTWGSEDIPHGVSRYCVRCSHCRSDWPSYKTAS